MTIHEYPTASSAGPGGSRRNGPATRLSRDLDGAVWSIMRTTLCTWSPIAAVRGRRQSEELLRHLHVHPRNPQAIPFVFKYYDRDWGLCASQELRDSLNEDAYRVVIRSSFEPGSLKVGEVVIPGESQQSFVLVAHLCHPAMVNDDLTGVVVGQMSPASCSPAIPLLYVRLLILPETIGSVAYLSHHEGLIPEMTGGLFLEMLGNDSPMLCKAPSSRTAALIAAELRLGALDRSATWELTGRSSTMTSASSMLRGALPMLSLSRVEAQN